MTVRVSLHTYHQNRTRIACTDYDPKRLPDVADRAQTLFRSYYKIKRGSALFCHTNYKSIDLTQMKEYRSLRPRMYSTT